MLRGCLAIRGSESSAFCRYDWTQSVSLATCASLWTPTVYARDHRRDFCCCAKRFNHYGSYHRCWDHSPCLAAAPSPDCYLCDSSVHLSLRCFTLVEWGSEFWMGYVSQRSSPLRTLVGASMRNERSRHCQRDQPLADGVCGSVEETWIEADHDAKEVFVKRSAPNNGMHLTPLRGPRSEAFYEVSSYWLSLQSIWCGAGDAEGVSPRPSTPKSTRMAV